MVLRHLRIAILSRESDRVARRRGSNDSFEVETASCEDDGKLSLSSFEGAAPWKDSYPVPR